MYIEYDEDVDCAFIWLVSDIDAHRKDFADEVWPAELNGEIGLLLTSDQRLLGIEVLSACKHLSPDLLATAQNPAR